ncbi:MAG: recombinase family protein [Vicinamibacterales bacterium]
MTRPALYARYSSDRQNERSIDDQLALCRQHLARLVPGGAAEPEIFADAAMSGATRARPGLDALLAAVAGGRVSLVVTEALDRVSRDLEDVAAIWKRLRHARVPLVTVHEGEIGDLHVGLRGTMNAMYLADLGAKTRRGQAGAVRAGRIPGGLSYGYRRVVRLDGRGEPVRGLREIDAAEAEVVRRIFRDYAAGASPRAIAAALNAEGVPGPRGGAWRANTIFGNRARRNGVLWNPLYRGLIAYNRQAFARDPDTRRRVARGNAREDWVEQPAPELAIVPAELAAAVEGRRRQVAAAPPGRRQRARTLLSGLLACGVCGGTVTSIGRGRLGCARHRETGACTNGRTVARHLVERRVVDGLVRYLLRPDVVAEVVKRAHDEATTRAAGDGARARRRDRRLAEIARAEARLVKAIEEGEESRPLTARLAALDGERRSLEAEAATAASGDAGVVALHPRLPQLYAAAVERLHATLTAPSADVAEAGAQLRRLVDRVVLTPGPARGELAVTIEGAAASLMQNAGPKAGVRRVQVVAGAGFEPATFRL